MSMSNTRRRFIPAAAIVHGICRVGFLSNRFIYAAPFAYVSGVETWPTIKAIPEEKSGLSC